jgi:chemotaxis protein methyltransferase CheR
MGRFIQAHCGIRMPPGKRVMLESRLRRRLRTLGLRDFRQYCELVLGGDEVELAAMVDEVTTNKTEFFREPRHFDYLATTVVPGLARAGLPDGLRVWSAACSTGEEPWTLAMVLSELAGRTPGFRFRILATDLCSTVLEEARGATYDHARIEPIPMALRHKYLLRQRDGGAAVRVAAALRQQVRFERVNLLERGLERFGPLEVIFCRNVFIYFERAVQREVLLRFMRALVPAGYLFLGHAESIAGLDLPLTQVAPTVYRKGAR